MSSVWVTLTWQEVSLAAMVGMRRRILGLQRGRPEPYGWDEGRDPWGSDIESSAAECAVAKYLDRYWTEPVADRLADLPGDVGPYEVRSTTREDGGLILHDADPSALFVLVRGRVPCLELAGWLWSDLGRRPEYQGRLRSPDDYLVPQACIEPIATLRHAIGHIERTNSPEDELFLRRMLRAFPGSRLETR